ncbi:hypothetical protein [Streptomyces sp. WM6378]|uniref:hypothetical protein n=1 Tax=Streptomyces sp. WM6378 TaxID=1415557 RepID=UPI0006ADD002|nr:hypothetical protein [Streptomyces sp. WM6378]KOU43573.1 hypothetical protein ADK54_17420 [Streptomyces sp. WM6378]
MAIENPIAVVQEHLDGLQQEHGPAHPEVIEAWTKLAELTGQRGDPRSAAILYQQLGDTLRERVGPFDGKVLDAYEGMARWLAGG